MAYDVILFDLDGTLTDSRDGIVNSISYALNKMGIPVEDRGLLNKWVGPPLMDSFRKYYGFSDEKARKGVELYREYFSAGGMYENRLFPGIKELLLELKKKGKTLVVCTSKPTVFTQKILEHFSIARYFDIVLGSNLDGTMAEKTELIRTIINTYPLPKDRFVMVGDRKEDLIGAKNNRIDSVFVKYGYGAEDNLQDAMPKYSARTVEELRQIL